MVKCCPDKALIGWSAGRQHREESESPRLAYARAQQQVLPRQQPALTPSVLKDSLQPHGHARLLALPISCHRKSSDTSQVNAATSGDWEVDRQKSNAACESNLDHGQAVARHEIGRHDHRGCLRALGHTVAQRCSRCTRNDRISRACWPSWDKLREDKLRESSVF